MATQAERQKAYRERKRATGKRDRLYFATDGQDQLIREYLDKGDLPKLGAIPPETVAARDRMDAIRDRLDRAEKRTQDKEGNPLSFWGTWNKLGERMEKVQKENDKEVQDLVMLLARRAEVI
ncbi:MAG: hypothetical protein ACYCT9_04740 [Leptospirillum sp.]|jgi:hypothetical protein